jgi:hyperosmotically inducible protein
VISRFHLQTSRATISCALAVALLASHALVGYAQDTTKAVAPDNTKRNTEAGATAGQQKENKSDRELTQKVRRAITAAKSLSIYAHNVKIVTIDGNVVLRGPVRSEEEKAAIETKAVKIAGKDHVKNEIEVAPKTS